MSSSRYRAFYFVFNIFTGHVILLKHCSDMKYQNDGARGKWRPHLPFLIYAIAALKPIFENARPLIMVVKRFITREETTVDRELQPHLA